MAVILWQYPRMSCNKCFQYSKHRGKAVHGVWIKEQEQHLLKFRTTVSCLYPTAERMPAIYIPAPGQWCVWIPLDSPPLANQREAQMKILDPGPTGNSACALQQGGERDGRGPVFGAVLEVLDVYHACCACSGCRYLCSDGIGFLHVG